MTERKHEADKCIISPAACVLVRTGRQSIHPRHVAVRTPTADEWWTPLVRPKAVRLSPNDGNVQKIRSISLTLSSSSLFFPLSWRENHCNLYFSGRGRFGWFLAITIWILIHTITLVRISVWHLSPLRLSSRPFVLVSFVCGCGFEWSCAPHVVPSQRSTGGHRLWPGDTLKMSLFGCALVYDTVHPAPMISSPQCGLLLCLRGIMNGK